MVTSATRRSRCPYDVPRLTTAAIGAKNGVWCPSTSLATSQATPAAIAHWAIAQRLDCHRFTRARNDSRLRLQARSRGPAASMAEILPCADGPGRAHGRYRDCA